MNQRAAIIKSKIYTTKEHQSNSLISYHLWWLIRLQSDSLEAGSQLRLLQLEVSCFFPLLFQKEKKEGKALAYWVYGILSFSFIAFITIGKFRVINGILCLNSLSISWWGPQNFQAWST